MNNSKKIKIMLAAIVVISLVAAIFISVFQNRALDSKNNILRASFAEIPHNYIEEVKFPVKGNENDLLYYSDTDQGFYGLDLATGNRNAKCPKIFSDVSVNMVNYNQVGNKAVVFATTKTDQSERVYGVDLRSCKIQKLDDNILGISWLENDQKVLLAEYIEAANKTNLVVSNSNFNNERNITSVEGMLSNINWLDNNDFGYYYLPTDASPTNLSSVNITSGYQKSVLKDIKYPDLISFSRDGQLVTATQNQNGVVLWKSRLGKLNKVKTIANNSLNNILGITWIDNKNLIVTQGDSNGNTGNVWLADSEKGSLKKLVFNKNGLDYYFSDFVRLDDNRIVGLSFGIPYLFTVK